MSNDLTLIEQVRAALSDAEVAWGEELGVTDHGERVHIHYVGTAHMSNVLVLTEAALAAAPTLAVTRHADHLVVTGYSKVQRDAARQVRSLDAELEKNRADFVDALMGNAERDARPWRIADAVPYYADTLARLEVTRELWADLEKSGDVAAVVGKALNLMAAPGGGKATLDAAMVEHRRYGARQFVRAQALHLLGALPTGLTDALFNI